MASKLSQSTHLYRSDNLRSLSAPVPTFACGSCATCTDTAPPTCGVPSSDPEACGSCPSDKVVCPADPGQVATCTAGDCGLQCDSDNGFTGPADNCSMSRLAQEHFLSSYDVTYEALRSGYLGILPCCMPSPYRRQRLWLVFTLLRIKPWISYHLRRPQLYIPYSGRQRQFPLEWRYSL